MWNLQCKIIAVISGSTGIVTKALRKILETIPGKNSIDSLQKTGILGTLHLIQKVLQSETWSLSSGDCCWFRRSTRKKKPVTKDNNNNNSNNNRSTFKEIGWVDAVWIHLAQDRDQCRLLWIWKWTFTSYNMWGNAYVGDKLLVYIEEPCYKELVSFASHCTE